MSRESLAGKFVPIEIGTRFGKQVVTGDGGYFESAEKGKRRRTKSWLVRCDCGSPERNVQGRALRGGRSLSCGCETRAAIGSLFREFLAGGGHRDERNGRYINPSKN